MKKLINVLCVLLALFICVGCLSGCNNRAQLTSRDGIVQALKDAGYLDAHIDEDYKNYIYLSSDEVEYFTILTITDLTDSEGNEYVASSELHNYRTIELVNIIDGKDYSSALNAVIPFFDKEYDNNGLEIINQLLEYEAQEEFLNTYKSGLYVTKDIVYERNTYNVYYYLSGNFETLEKSICFRSIEK